MKASKFAMPLALALLATQPVWADTTLAQAAHVAVEDEQPVHLTAQIVGIDKASRTLTLRDGNGMFVDVSVSKKVTRFDQLKVGDRVDVLYKNALLVTVSSPVKGGVLRERVDTQARVPTSDGFETVHQVELLATVQKIDREKRLVTLQGADRTQTFKAGPDVDLKDAKVGDVIHVVFASAAAVDVTPLNTSTQ